MALSLLQEAQAARGLAPGRIKLEHEERGLSMSPPMTTGSNSSSNPANLLLGSPGSHSQSSMYSNLLPTTAMGMLAPHFLAANQQAAAAALMGLPMSLRATLAASGLFPHPHTLFSAWANAHQQTPSNGSHSPPSSGPISPALSSKSLKRLNLNNNNPSAINNNHIVSTTTDCLSPISKNQLNYPKKAVKRRQISVKKDLLSPVHSDITINSPEMINNGPISPPTSGSSPQSTGSIDHPAISTTNPTKDMSRDKVFTCKTCNRSFGYKHVLQNHERTHTGEKPFECPECHKRFTRDHHLKTHMRLHTGEKPYHCSHCDRQFVQVANLRRHLRVHTGERPYACELCDAKFSDSNQLKAHNLIHNGEKPFGCERCGARFRRRHHLMHHKCGMTSPPTPVMSPAMSSLSDLKSASSRSDASDESIDLSKTSLQHQMMHLHSSPMIMNPMLSNNSPPYSMPLDLSDETTPDLEKRNRKSGNIRRVIRMPSQIMQVPTEIPEQTEPEDLSMHSPRSVVSPISHDDEDFDELDDAASLYMKHRLNANQCQSIES